MFLFPNGNNINECKFSRLRAAYFNPKSTLEPFESATEALPVQEGANRGGAVPENLFPKQIKAFANVKTQHIIFLLYFVVDFKSDHT